MIPWWVAVVAVVFLSWVFFNLGNVIGFCQGLSKAEEIYLKLGGRK